MKTERNTGFAKIPTRTIQIKDGDLVRGEVLPERFHDVERPGVLGGVHEPGADDGVLWGVPIGAVDAIDAGRHRVSGVSERRVSEDVGQPSVEALAVLPLMDSDEVFRCERRSAMSLGAVAQEQGVVHGQ